MAIDFEEDYSAKRIQANSITVVMVRCL